jgi:FkbM family methyltransferase
VIAFVLAQCDHGAMIVNRLDYNQSFNGAYYGVGAQIMETGAYDATEIEMLGQLLHLRRQYYGDGVMVLDCGANIGVHTIALAELMKGWGSIIAVEAQERLFYALAGNLALHNCFNARAIWAAIDKNCGFLDIPEPDYKTPSSFGSFELKQRLGNENIGQAIDYDKKTSRVSTFSIDSANLERCDLIKMDIEGMEIDAIDGAMATIGAHKPLLYIECIKVDRKELERRLSGLDYRFLPHGLSLLAAHESDKTFDHIKPERRVA